MRILFLMGCTALALAATTAAQRTPPAASALPPIVMTCETHPEIVEARAGVCPLCRMPLVPVRLDASWMCPVHTTVIESNDGACRICRRDLIPVTVALTWTCRGESAAHLEPGVCADGAPRIGRKTLRPHGNHNPKHGGQFFMAPDNWHHLEGTYPRDRTFRLYIYDDYAKPLPPDRIRQVIARVVTEETFDPATRTTKDIKAFPLRASGNGAYLEARIDQMPLPGAMTAKVRLKRDAPEYRFDFTFAALTREPAAPSRAAAAPRAPARVAPAAAPQPAPVTEPDPLVAVPIPGSMEEMVSHLRIRARQVGELIEQGNLEAVYVPAFQAKDIAVALEPHLTHLLPARRERAAPALEAVVRTAWLLDAYGDVGNRPQIAGAYTAFSAAVSDVVAAFAESQP